MHTSRLSIVGLLFFAATICGGSIARAQHSLSQGLINEYPIGSHLESELRSGWTVAPAAIAYGSGATRSIVNNSGTYTFTYQEGADTLTYTWQPSTGSSAGGYGFGNDYFVGNYNGVSFKPFQSFRVSWDDDSPTTNTTCTTTTTATSGATLDDVVGGFLIGCDDSQLANGVVRCDFRATCSTAVSFSDNAHTFAVYVALVGRSLIVEFAPRVQMGGTFSGSACTSGHPSQYFYYDPDCRPSDADSTGADYIDPGVYAVNGGASPVLRAVHLPYSDKFALATHTVSGESTMFATAIWDFVTSGISKGIGTESMTIGTSSSQRRLAPVIKGDNGHERLIFTVSDDPHEVFPRSPFNAAPYFASVAARTHVSDWDSYGVTCNASSCMSNSCTTSFERTDVTRMLPLTQYGLYDVFLLRHDWQKNGYDRSFDVYEAKASYGGSCGMQKLATALNAYTATAVSNGELGILFGLHSVYDPRAFTAAVGTQTTAATMTSCGSGSCASTEEPSVHMYYGTGASFLDVTSAMPGSYITSSSEDAATVYDRSVQLAQYMRTTHEGPLAGEGGAVNLRWAGVFDHLDGEFASVNRNSGASCPFDGRQAALIPDFKLYELHDKAVFAGIGYEHRWWYGKSSTSCTGVAEASVSFAFVGTRAFHDEKRAVQLLFANQNGFSLAYDERPDTQMIVAEHYALGPIQQQYLQGATVVSTEYWDGTDWLSLAEALAANYDFSVDAVVARTTWSNGLVIIVNLSDTLYDADVVQLPRGGYLATNTGLSAFFGHVDGGDDVTVTAAQGELFFDARGATVNMLGTVGVRSNGALRITRSTETTLDVYPVELIGTMHEFVDIVHLDLNVLASDKPYAASIVAYDAEGAVIGTASYTNPATHRYIIDRGDSAFRYEITLSTTETCVPSCDGGFECGDDGCGGSCGSCSGDLICINHFCEEPGACIPDCTGRECGSDGCEGFCGGCADGEECYDGICAPIGTEFADSGVAEIDASQDVDMAVSIDASAPFDMQFDLAHVLVDAASNVDMPGLQDAAHFDAGGGAIDAGGGAIDATIPDASSVVDMALPTMDAAQPAADAQVAQDANVAMTDAAVIVTDASSSVADAARPPLADAASESQDAAVSSSKGKGCSVTFAHVARPNVELLLLAGAAALFMRRRSRR